MNKQLIISASEYAGKQKATRRERFLGEMEKVVPWVRLIALIEPCYPKGERGRLLIGIERMLGSISLRSGKDWLMKPLRMPSTTARRFGTSLVGGSWRRKRA